MRAPLRRPILIFCIWLVSLLIIGLFRDRSPRFFDIITQSDISPAYSSSIPLVRIIFEPFIGSNYALFADYSLDIWVPLSIPILYSLGRIIWVWMTKHWAIHPQSRLDHLIYAFRVAIDWSCLCLFLGLSLFFLSALVIRWQFGFITTRSLAYRLLHGWILILFFLTIVIFVGMIIWKYYSHLSLKLHQIQPKFPRWVHEIKLSGEFFLLLGIIVMNCLSMPLPTQRIQTNLEEGDYLFDFHVHTTYSNGFLTPEQRVQWYIEQGIHGAAFSDHLSTKSAFQAQAYVNSHHLQFTVLIAQEYIASDPKIHLNIYGITESITPIDLVEDPSAVNCLNTSEMISYVKSHGGYVTVNHFIGNGNNPAYSLETLQDWGVDGFEVTNAGAELDSSIREFCLANNLAILAGTDEHANQETNAFVKFHLPSAENLTVDSIFSVLKQNHHEVVLVEYYPPRFQWPIFLSGVKIVWKFLNYLVNLSWLQWISWIGWSIIAFGVYIGFYSLFKKWNRIQIT